MNGKLFIDYLSSLIRNVHGQMVYIIVDNLRVHHAKLVTQWLEEHSDEIKLFYLPAYCPELNPDEVFNHLFKQEFQSIIQPQTKEELTATVGKILKKLQMSPDKIKSIFNKNEVKYAAGH
jgi:transposase